MQKRNSERGRKRKNVTVKMGGCRIFLREGKKVYLIYLSVTSSFKNLQQICLAYRIKPMFTVGAVTWSEPSSPVHTSALCIDGSLNIPLELSCCCLCSLRNAVYPNAVYLSRHSLVTTPRGSAQMPFLDFVLHPIYFIFLTVFSNTLLR